MNSNLQRIGFGGGCHWCTEGVFQSLIGITQVEQGWISSIGEESEFSEAIIVSFDEKQINLRDLIEIHLHTHASTSNHPFRTKYRSAIYYMEPHQKDKAEEYLLQFQGDFENPIITKVLPFSVFKLNTEEHLNYLYTRKNNGFCQSYIHPKLRLLLDKFTSKVNKEKIEQFNIV